MLFFTRYRNRSPDQWRRISASLALLASCTGCTSLLVPQTGEKAVRMSQIRGAPSYIMPDGSDTLHEYNEGPFGQTTWIGRIGADGRIKSYTQVLTAENFARITPGMPAIEVEKIVGHPYEISEYARQPGTAWNYGWRESNAFNVVMTIFMDADNRVLRLENGQDPRYSGGLF